MLLAMYFSHVVFIICIFIDYVRIGNTEAPLLAVTPFATGECKFSKDKAFKSLYMWYIYYHISQTDIEIYNGAGELVPFVSDNLIPLSTLSSSLSKRVISCLSCVHDVPSNACHTHFSDNTPSVHRTPFDNLLLSKEIGRPAWRTSVMKVQKRAQVHFHIKAVRCTLLNSHYPHELFLSPQGNCKVLMALCQRHLKRTPNLLTKYFIHPYRWDCLVSLCFYTFLHLVSSVMMSLSWESGDVMRFWNLL